jgi:hypothetical protein
MRDLEGSDADSSEFAEIASRSGPSEDIHISLDSHPRTEAASFGSISRMTPATLIIEKYYWHY